MGTIGMKVEKMRCNCKTTKQEKIFKTESKWDFKNVVKQDKKMGKIKIGMYYLKFFLFPRYPTCAILIV